MSKYGCITFIDNLILEATRPTVAILAGAFKPPHAGHMHMVEEYAKRVDKVVILVTNPKSAKSQRTMADGRVVTAEMSLKLWQIMIKASKLKNVEAQIVNNGSGIGSVYKYMSDLQNTDIILGVSTKDNDYKRYGNAPKYIPETNKLLDVKANAVEPLKGKQGNISAIDIRNNVVELKDVLPKFMSKKDIEQYREILNGN